MQRQKQQWQRVKEYAASERIGLVAAYKRARLGRVKWCWSDGLMMIDAGSYRPRQSRPWYGAASQPPFPPEVNHE